jgi:hypothetical protein
VSTSSNTSNTESDTIDGDCLRLLLEQKLRELTSGVRSPYSKPANGVRIYAPSPVLDDAASACDTSSIASTDYDRDSIQSFKDGKDEIPRSDLVSKNDQVCHLRYYCSCITYFPSTACPMHVIFLVNGHDKCQKNAVHPFELDM